MKRQGDLPEGFFERLERMFGINTAQNIARTLAERPTVMRVNTLKATKEEVREALVQDGYKLRTLRAFPLAFILENKSKRELTEHQLYTEGKIYLQSLASMSPPLVLQPKPGDTVLDLTAAPGSKTSQMAAMMERKGKLVANDKNKVRFFKLKHNLELLGAATPGDDFVTMRMEDGSRLCGEFENTFDKILLDAPCSAESRFITGDPRSFGYWKEMKIKEMAGIQRRLLLSAWRTLKPGGLLVYSTCTYAPEENELQIARFLEKAPDAELIPAVIEHLPKLPILKSWKDKPIPESIQKTLRIMPDKDIEGFYIAAIRKGCSNS